MAPDSPNHAVWLPLDDETRERLMARAREEGENPLELGAALLAAKLAEDARATRRRAH